MKKFNLTGVALLASTVLMGAGQAYAAQTTPDPAQAKTPVNVELTAPTTDGTVTPPLPDQGGNGGESENNGNGGDTGTGITGPFGIAYAPAALVAKNGTVELGEALNQEVELKSSSGDSVKKLNVGVRDMTQASGRSWTLSAQLKWDSKELVGSKIVATGAGSVRENVKGILKTTNKVENKVQTALEISGTSADIMGAKNDQVMSGTYNYQFNMPKLVIENPSNVEASTYNGNIVWNLSNAV